MKWLLVLLLVVASLFWLFHEPTPSKNEVIGIYTGSHKGYSEHLELTNDSIFKQALTTPSGEVMNSSGTWNLKHKALEMKGYIFFIDEQIEGSHNNPIKTGSVTFSAYRGMLIRDWDTGFYRLSKQ